MESFTDRHPVWTEDQRFQADELKRRVQRENLHLVRLAWADPHGYSRAKAVSVPQFLSALTSGYNINVATSTLDSAGARTFSSFTRGGGMGLPEMTGSPNLVIVPDPATFRVLPWAPGVGWVLCDEYFKTGVPFHFSPRHALKRQLKRLEEQGLAHIVGLEVEWYLLRAAEAELSDEHIGGPGVRGRPIRTTPVEPGYHYHSESNMDLMQPVLSGLAESFEKIGLKLRSMENEWGPGQVECTFAPSGALAAADDMLLFRTATRQVTRRMGYFATFMCRPALKGFYSSGWHLHESLVEPKSGRNLLMPESDSPPTQRSFGGRDVANESPVALAKADEHLSTFGKNFLGGLLEHAAAATVFAAPTVNGYRRFRPNSLAPDRAGWGTDHRGAMIRVLGGRGDTATRFENRLGEPAANPYLYIASQIIAGLAGVEGTADPGPPDDEPYAAERPLLPKSLGAALDALEKDTLFRREMGDIFIDYFLKLKRNELGRYLKFREEARDAGDDAPSEWEQNEYFDFF